MRVFLCFSAVLLATITNPAFAGSPSADRAVSEFRGGAKPYNVVQNRFFTKTRRFEASPVAGIVPNNPFVNRYVGGLMMAYHLSEELAVEGALMYAPDLGTGDLKGLTHTLVEIAQTSEGGENFQQPLNKMIMGATFAARWAPVYGKINLMGEKVLNFDFYGTAGLGMLTIAEYYAIFDEAAYRSGAGGANPQFIANKNKVPLNLGLGLDFFLTNSMALKFDARSYLYTDKKPQYDSTQLVNESRLYNNIIVSFGLGFYFPNMPERLQF